MNGFEVLERLNALAPRFPHVPFAFLTALADRDNELRARRLGADDYVTKPIDFDILEMIIKARLAGVARIEMRLKLLDLNDREIEVLTWVARGKTSAQIAEMLGLAKRTVDFHLDNARNKLGATTRTKTGIGTGSAMDNAAEHKPAIKPLPGDRATESVWDSPIDTRMTVHPGA